MIQFVNQRIEQAGHVDANIFVDKELAFVPEKDAKGIDVYRMQLNEELYDHSKDAQEWYNVIDNPENDAIIQQYRAQIPQERYKILGQGSTGHKSYSASETK